MGYQFVASKRKRPWDLEIRTEQVGNFGVCAWDWSFHLSIFYFSLRIVTSTSTDTDATQTQRKQSASRRKRDSLDEEVAVKDIGYKRGDALQTHQLRLGRAEAEHQG